VDTSPAEVAGDAFAESIDEAAELTGDDTAEEADDTGSADAEGAAATPAARGRRGATASPITVNVDVPRGLGRRISAKLVQQVVQRALEREGWDQPSTIDVVFVDDEEMREINATRRGIDEVTDVLSFPMVDF